MTARAETPGVQDTFPRKRVFTLALLAVALSALYAVCWVKLHIASTRGTVGIVDDIHASQESWRVGPAADVDVLILWRARQLNLPRPRSTCVRAVLTRTNARGEYFVDSWWLSPAWPMRIDGVAEVYVFKPGFTPLADRSRLAEYRQHFEILGPPAVNPWTGLVMPDEDHVKIMKDRFCPALERL